MVVKTGRRSAIAGRTNIRVRFALTLLLGLTTLPGCAHRYLIKLTNGDQMISTSKPNVKDGNYHFHSEGGQECVIPRSRVAKIETGAVEQEEKKTAPPSTPKKSKHWYFLWLA
jgi:hypothetical protein